MTKKLIHGVRITATPGEFSNAAMTVKVEVVNGVDNKTTYNIILEPDMVNSHFDRIMSAMLSVLKKKLKESIKEIT